MLWFIEFLKRRGWTYHGYYQRKYIFFKVVPEVVLWVYSSGNRYTLVIPPHGDEYESRLVDIHV